MSIPGRYFDGKTSAVQTVEVNLLRGGRLHIRLLDKDIDASLAELRLSDRIGRMQRHIRFADGGVCEIQDNDSVDQWLANAALQGGGGDTAGPVARAVFKLEQRWVYAILALLSVGLLSWGFIRYGIPILAQMATDRLPLSVDTRLGAETLALVDKSLFRPSQLSPLRQRAIRDRFVSIIEGLPMADRYELEFRSGGTRVGANAFALPSGVVVITDELIRLAKDDNEITAVLAHEVGHVVHRHATRMLLETSASALVLFAVLGDITSVSSLAAGAPALLTQARYSRQLETEADAYSYEWLRRHGIATHYFTDLLVRLEAAHAGSGTALSYFSSHPQTAQRIHDQPP